MHAETPEVTNTDIETDTTVELQKKTNFNYQHTNYTVSQKTRHLTLAHNFTKY